MRKSVELPMDVPAVERLIKERFPGKREAFLSRAGVDATTLGRWLAGAHHPQPEKFLRFCGALDVDFFSILNVSEKTVGRFARKIVQAVLLSDWAQIFPTFSFLREFLLSPGEWPSASMLPYYSLMRDREWRVWEYRHDPTQAPSSCYGTIELTSSVDPQVWYFAFQEPQGIAWMWFRYGCVRRRWEEILLLNFVAAGEIERAQLPPDSGRLQVQTYLHARPMNFRIASLHPFEARLLDAPSALPTLCFRCPGVVG